jgi:electron transfer flavoprotein beta subunit
MKVLVAIKRVVDAEVKVRPKPDGTGVDTANVRMAMNPFDEVAVEEAVTLKERGLATEVIAVSCGPLAGQDTLRTAFAFGIDRGILVETEAELQPLAVAKLLKAVVEREQPALVLCGKQAIDDDSNQVGQMLAALLGWAQATAASHLDLDEHRARITREVDGGSEILEVPLPLVVTADLRLNLPRYPALPNVLKAKKRPVEVVQPTELQVDVRPRLTTVQVIDASRRRGGVMVTSAVELLAKLRDEAGVIA